MKMKNHPKASSHSVVTTLKIFRVFILSKINVGINMFAPMWINLHMHICICSNAQGTRYKYNANPKQMVLFGDCSHKQQDHDVFMTQCSLWFHRTSASLTVDGAFLPRWPGRKGLLAHLASYTETSGSLWQQLMSSLRAGVGFHGSVPLLFSMWFGHFEEGILFQNCLNMFSDKYRAVWKHIILSDICLVCYLLVGPDLFSGMILSQQKILHSFWIASEVIYIETKSQILAL